MLTLYSATLLNTFIVLMGLCVHVYMHECLRIFYLQNLVICKEFYCFLCNLEAFHFLFPNCVLNISSLNIFNPFLSFNETSDQLVPQDGPLKGKHTLRSAGPEPLLPSAALSSLLSPRTGHQASTLNWPPTLHLLLSTRSQNEGEKRYWSEITGPRDMSNPPSSQEQQNYLCRGQPGLSAGG